MAASYILMMSTCFNPDTCILFQRGLGMMTMMMMMTIGMMMMMSRII